MSPQLLILYVWANFKNQGQSGAIEFISFVRYYQRHFPLWLLDENVIFFAEMKIRKIGPIGISSHFSIFQRYLDEKINVLIKLGIWIYVIEGDR
jgi:hypothetical protein